LGLLFGGDRRIARGGGDRVSGVSILRLCLRIDADLKRRGPAHERFGATLQVEAMLQRREREAWSAPSFCAASIGQLGL
jgi:hypothetical protein